MSRDIEADPIQSIIRSVLIVLAACAVAWSANAGELEICYSKFSPARKPEFKGALTEELITLHDTLGDAYNDDDMPVIAIPLRKKAACISPARANMQLLFRRV